MDTGIKRKIKTLRSWFAKGERTTGVIFLPP
jgi:hypothetical protein